MSATMRQPHFAGLLGLAWLLVMLQLVAQHFGETAQTLNDTDDAMRLAQFKDWLDGQGWYDLNYARDRAGLRVALVPADRCRARRHAPGLRACSRTGSRRAADAHGLADAVAAADDGGDRRDRVAHRGPRGRAGRAVAGAGRTAGVPPVPARPHRSSQCADRALGAGGRRDGVVRPRALGGALRPARSPASPSRSGSSACPIWSRARAAFAARYALDRAGARPAADYGLALASSTLVGFLVVVEPGHWGRGVCDAIALNWLALALARRARPRARRHTVRTIRATGTLCARRRNRPRSPPRCSSGSSRAASRDPTP